ncbi:MULTISPECIES: hypothetical protein [Lysobacter]|uniref:hypothetical protein n=1 Tax=Lysobacter TaxID=68 RepID=UPI001CC0A88A|nr:MULTISPECIES: hypothetical protein [Lysobacter]UJB19304.1 hypothetical protein L1A79_23815 [Lysobacter capsici]UJQ26971.1 hypothetical protein L2D09_16070 [Lysobacter gummosus]
MSVFALEQYDKDFSQFRELREAEMASVGGGYQCPNGKESTITVHVDGSKDDGCDAS